MEWGSEGIGKQESFTTVARTADVLEDTKFVCILRMSTGKGKMSYYHLRTANCPACRSARRLCFEVNRHENSAIDK